VSYLTFVRCDVPGRKTPVFEVQPVTDSARLGAVKWYAPWRRYCFYPAPDTIFDAGCLDELAAFIAERMRERKMARAGGKG